MREDAHGYDGRGRESPRWWPSRYGATDLLGAGNELTAERTLQALSLATTGELIELAQILEPGVPAVYPRSVEQRILAHGALEGLPAVEGVNDVTWFEEIVIQPYQIGCHVDGLGHLGIAGHYYNGVHYREFYEPRGLLKLGIETIRPWICRGICLDIAALEGVRQLPEGFVITAAHLEAACHRHGVEVKAGDAVLIHTGWSELWMNDNQLYSSVEPGVGWEGAHWLTERRVSLVGADNWSFEPIPFEDPEKPYLVHQHLLAETGTYILENITTAELVEAHRPEFLFVLAPPKTKGSTGAMAAPVAVL
jgi:kynurenine formamidase